MMETVPAGQAEQPGPCRLSPRALGPRDAAASRDPWWRAASGAGIPAAHPDTDTWHRLQENERRKTASYSVKNAKILARSAMEGMSQTALFQPQRSLRPERQER